MNLKQAVRNKRTKKGFALVFVILIAAAMMIPVLMLISSTIPRRANVTGEAVSDRVLAVADAAVDKILAQINTFPSMVSTDSTLKAGFDNIATYYSNNHVSDDDPDTLVLTNKEAKTVISKYAITYLLATLNGGKAYQPSSTADPQTPLQAYTDSNLNTYPSGGVTDGSGSLWDIEDNVSTYLYDLTNQEFYAVVDGTGSDAKIAPVQKTGISGDILTKPIKNLSTGEIRTNIDAWDWDSTYETDNRWVEIDTNTQYEDDGTAKAQSTRFEIRVSAYPLTNSGTQYIVRNILAEATLQPLTTVSLGNSGAESGPYDKALWSGHGLTINGNVTVAAADTLGGAYLHGEGDIYADGIVTLHGNGISIGGSVMTSQAVSGGIDPIVLSGNPSLGGRVYSKQETLPNFPTGTEDSVKAAALTAYTYYSSDYSASNTTLAVSGGNWYINRNMTLDGTTIDFGSDPLKPGVIWVNGDIIFKSGTVIEGQGMIVANGKITFQGKSSGLTYADSTSMVAIISEGVDSLGGIDMQGDHDFMGLFYAPHSNIIVDGNGTVFGSVIAGGYISSTNDGLTLNGAKNTFVYDTRWGKTNIGQPAELLTGTGSVRFAGSAIYRFLWKEVISKPVTQNNIQLLKPQFVFIP
jgi:hypothetical protein